MKQYSNLPKELVTIIIIPYLHDSDDKSIELIASPSWTIPQFNNLPPATSMAFRMESNPPKQDYFRTDDPYDYDRLWLTNLSHDLYCSLIFSSIGQL
jgi:hypothetical protein